jgi:NADPH:quinone reductase-like Zn-dependent oxidoreductase
MELVEVPQPEVRDDSLLIRVIAASVNRSDWENLTGWPLYSRMGGLRHPREQVLGSDVAGVVEQVGDTVTEFKPGDEVLGDVLYHGKGGFSEYVSVPEKAPLVRKPTAVSFEQAATLPQAAVLALQGIRHGEGLQAGQHLLINGAGGGGGTFAIQLAKQLGAEITAVDSAEKFEAMTEAGADQVIDYHTADYTRAGSSYDRILDFVGSRPLLANRRVLADGGVYLLVGGPMRRLLMAATTGWLISRINGKHMGLLMARPNRDDLREAADLVATGKLEPIIDRVYPLEEVPAAMRRLGEGHSLGKLVIRM